MIKTDAGRGIHPNAQAISRFYSAFAACDHRAMAEQYGPTVEFSDPVFTTLDYEQATAMWRMFCSRGNDLVVSFGSIQADDVRGSAEWEATYTFTPTGRGVHNVIDASFEFADGRIVAHRDRFDLYAWTRMALGPLGWALGWSPIMKNRVRATARAQLDRFMQGEE